MSTSGQRRAASSSAPQVVIAVRYVLDLPAIPTAPTVDWTFVEGEIVTDSTGGWRFTPRATARRSTTARRWT